MVLHRMYQSTRYGTPEARASTEPATSAAPELVTDALTLRLRVRRPPPRGAPCPVRRRGPRRWYDAGRRRGLHERGLALSVELADGLGVAEALEGLAAVARARGDEARAERLLTARATSRRPCSRATAPRIPRAPATPQRILEVLPQREALLHQSLRLVELSLETGHHAEVGGRRRLHRHERCDHGAATAISPLTARPSSWRPQATACSSSPATAPAGAPSRRGHLCGRGCGWGPRRCWAAGAGRGPARRCRGAPPFPRPQLRRSTEEWAPDPRGADQRSEPGGDGALDFLRGAQLEQQSAFRTGTGSRQRQQAYCSPNATGPCTAAGVRSLHASARGVVLLGRWRRREPQRAQRVVDALHSRISLGSTLETSRDGAGVNFGGDGNAADIVRGPRNGCHVSM